MTQDKKFIGPYLDHVLELEKLDREGATLKNVSDNMRALTACIGIFIAISLAFQTPYTQLKVIAVVWGIWTTVYGGLACFQSGLLFATAMQDLFLKNLMKGRSDRLKDWVAYVFTLMSMAFMFGGIVMIEASIRHMVK